MNRLIFLLAAALFSASGLTHADSSKDIARPDISAADRKQFAKEEKIILVVGISSYPKGGGLTRLEYADADAKALGQEFQKLGYTVVVLLNEEATRGAILNQIDDLSQLLDKDEGTFVFAFSGHGFSRGEVNFLAPFEADKNDIDRTGINVVDVLTKMQESGAKRRVVFLDACRDDPSAGGKSVGGGKSFVKFKEAEGQSILFSTKFGRKSWEYSDLGHGVFTYFMLKGLRGAAVGADHFLTFRGLSDYVADQVKNFGAERKNIQVPFTELKASGDFLLASDVPADAAPSPSIPTVKARQAGEVFRDRLKDGNQGPEMVVIPAGSFNMGSLPGEAGREDDEGPVQRVKIGKPFALAKHELTVGEFGRFVSATNYRTEAERNEAQSCYAYSDTDKKFDWRAGLSWKNPGYKQSDDHPVVCVSYNDVEKYISWISEQTGKRYGLPSEAEWEYAARGRTTPTSESRYWGDEPSEACRYANVADKSKSPEGVIWSDKHECNDGHWYPAPVGSYLENSFGLKDMLGNVWEWTADCWNANYRGAPTDGSAWTGGDCGRRVVRGGSWSIIPAGVRSAFRLGYDTANRSNGHGFRLAQDL